MVSAPASADTGALAAYLRARVADDRGEVARAATDYGVALAAAPDAAIAIRAYREALSAGDMGLATRALAVLDRVGVTPEDAQLLRLADAARVGDAARVEAVATRLAAGRLALLVPPLRAWVARGCGADPLPVLDAAADPAARRLATETRALLLAAAGRRGEAVAQIQLLGGSSAPIDLRVATAQALADPALARRLFPGDEAALADALARAPVRPSLGFGVSRLLTRIASDLSAGEGPNPLVVTLARAALIAEPGNDRARLLLANRLVAEDATGPALALLAEIAPDSPFGPAAASARITVLTATNRRPEALADAARLAARSGAGRDEWQAYADLLTDSGRASEAVPFYHRIAQSDGAGEWVVWMQLGAALEAAGDWPRARAALAKAVELAPDEPVALNYLGYARVTRGEAKRESTALLERAHRLAPDNASIADSLGWAYHLTGDTPRALPLLESAARGEPDSAEIGEHLGDVYWALGRRYEARYAWTAAQAAAEEKDRARLAGKLARGL